MKCVCVSTGVHHCAIHAGLYVGVSSFVCECPCVCVGFFACVICVKIVNTRSLVPGWYKMSDSHRRREELEWELSVCSSVNVCGVCMCEFVCVCVD